MIVIFSLSIPSRVILVVLALTYYSISFYRNNTVELTQPTYFLVFCLLFYKIWLFPMMQTKLKDIQNSAHILQKKQMNTEFFKNSAAIVIYLKSSVICFSSQTSYRVSHIEDCKVNQVWGLEGSIILLNYGALWVQEVLNLCFIINHFSKK